MNALFLAFAYLRHNWGRSLVLVLVAALILAVPLVAQVILAGSEKTLMDRAEATPLVLGRRGSQLDLAMNSLYFSDDRAEPVTMAAAEEIWEADLGIPVPLHTAFESNGARIIGTSIDYFDLRSLTIGSGRQFALLGEAVIGAEVASRLSLGPGDTVVSAPENLFDLDGVYPLELQITGVLDATGQSDDQAVFVDVQTAWVIAGIGHGHDDVVTEDADGNLVANAAIRQFNRITEANIDSFHFHGDPGEYPVSAVLVFPDDRRAETILRGRYLDPENPLQMIVPREVIGNLVDRIFRIKALLDAVTVVIGTAAALAVGLALFLSWRLRSPEVATAVKLGARPGMIAGLIGAEIAILLGFALCLASIIVLVVRARGDELVGWLLSLGA